MGTPVPHRDPSPVVVLKFGGTSVATEDARAALARRVQETIDSAERPVLVVSALGRAPQPYATDSLISLLDGFDPDPRELDLLMSCGETISAVFVAHVLRDAQMSARALTGAQAGIYAEERFGCAAITAVAPQAIQTLIDKGVVPVVAGFQGVTPNGETVTLGRGGSDTTAAALGVALKAHHVDIYTDVDGIMTADPRACEDVSVLRRISSDELFQMARSGSKVVHAPAAELAFASGAVLRVKNTFSSHPGTEVVDISAYRPDQVATAVSHTAGVARIRVTLPYVEDAEAHMHTQTVVYRAMADAGISLDMFTPLNDRMVFTVAEEDVSRAEGIIQDLGYTHATRRDLAKVTLVGAGMHGVPGVMARIAECLAAKDVDILQTSDSHATISVLVRESHMCDAIAALCSEFGL